MTCNEDHAKLQKSGTNIRGGGISVIGSGSRPGSVGDSPRYRGVQAGGSTYVYLRIDLRMRDAGDRIRVSTAAAESTS